MHSAVIRGPAQSNTAPLVVDLEGALLKTNRLLESLLVLLKQNPLLLFVLLVWLLRGKSFFKQQVAHRGPLEVSLLPYREDVLNCLRAQHAQGRRLLLATTVDLDFAWQVARHLKIFDAAFVSDRPVAASLESGLPTPPRRAFAAYLKPLRLRHWLKNLLVFVPVFAAHRFVEPAMLAKTLLAFLAFGCCASSGYLVNDLFDLAADRHHPQKRFRSFAAGDLPLGYGLAAIPVLAGLGLLTGLLVSPLLLGALLLYMTLTTAYSFWMRRVALLDVIALAGLYTMRILAGSAAVAIRPSHALLAFSTFLFFSLALVKRYGELVIMRSIDGENAKARGYQLSDEELLASMGIASGYLAVLVLALYINSATAHVLYRHYQVMWLLCPLVLYWTSHTWLTAHRGKMPDDPLVFATHDRTSRFLILLMLTVILIAL